MEGLILQTPSELTKANAEVVADSIIAQGMENPVDMMVKIKYMTTIIDSVKDGIKERFKDEMFRQPGGRLTMHGADIVYQSGYDEADYEQDAEYCKLKEAFDARKALLKAAFKAKHPIVDESTGETIPVLPTGKITADKVNVSLRKQ